MDTVFTVAFTLAAGLVPGVVCGVFSNVIISGTYLAGWPYYLFALCNIATALVTALFVRLFPRELNFSAKTAEPLGASRGLSKVMDRVVVCVLLSFALCLAMSVLGRMTAAAISVLVRAPAEERPAAPESVMLAFSMFPANLPVLPREILSRIPVNIVDRLISAFAGYGIALALRALMRRFGLKAAPVKR